MKEPLLPGRQVAQLLICSLLQGSMHNFKVLCCKVAQLLKFLETARTVSALKVCDVFAIF